jgi:hypothetical protein
LNSSFVGDVTGITFSISTSVTSFVIDYNVDMMKVVMKTVCSGFFAATAVAETARNAGAVLLMMLLLPDWIMLLIMMMPMPKSLLVDAAAEDVMSQVAKFIR